MVINEDEDYFEVDPSKVIKDKEGFPMFKIAHRIDPMNLQSSVPGYAQLNKDFVLVDCPGLIDVNKHNEFPI